MNSVTGNIPRQFSQAGYNYEAYRDIKSYL